MTCRIEERGEHIAGAGAGAGVGGLGFAWVGLIMDVFKGKQASNAASVDALYAQQQQVAIDRAAEARTRTITTIAIVGGVIGLLAMAGGLTYILGKK